MNLNKIKDAKHIMIVANSYNIFGASSLYTHILRLHKKVTLVCFDKNIDPRLSFLPWFEKIRTTQSSSADLTIEFNYTSIEFIILLKNSNIKINNKMATALYAGILEETDGFTNSKTDGTIFAIANELIQCGADYKTCTSFIIKRVTLSSLRLKALMLKKMILQNDSKAAIFRICDNDLTSTGASYKDCYKVMKESLGLVHVEMAILINTDKENELLKLIYKEQ